jgi:hypothetical protein
MDPRPPEFIPGMPQSDLDEAVAAEVANRQPLRDPNDWTDDADELLRDRPYGYRRRDAGDVVAALHIGDDMIDAEDDLEAAEDRLYDSFGSGGGASTGDTRSAAERAGLDD